MISISTMKIAGFPNLECFICVLLYYSSFAAVEVFVGSKVLKRPGKVKKFVLSV
ncbi:hypothetical protein L21SP2_2849 [Salinispira pacifica]|uniref:Uncharacterized protein n=1 Tax=Salinispira pacifica TaxID=1307761 RepID=V5WK54_9SPIO|nr:hypothetical protein L21SP2_2849 [Salinispira pacifica]